MTSKQPGRPTATVPTSSWQPGHASRLALLEGTVQGQQTGPDRCRIWVERDSGKIVPVVWPAGYRARLDPLELLDPVGRVVAVAGTVISVPGGLMPADPERPDGPKAFHVMSELPPL
jgi:hypothetical protein